MNKLFLAALIMTTGLTQSKAEPVCALIAKLEGAATIGDGHGHSSAAHRFDSIGCGSVVEGGAASVLVLVLASGQRFELGPGARITLTSGGPEDEIGLVRALSPVAPMPKLPGIAPEARASARAAAVRVRAGTPPISNLFPKQGYLSLPDRTVLRFSPMPGFSEYRVELRDDTGKKIFQIQTLESEIVIPTGALKPGVHYYWQVRAFSALGMSSRGEAEFDTLSADEVTRRAAFEAALPAADADALVLLAVVDWKMGLLTDAENEFRAALDRSAYDEEIRVYLAGC